MIKQVLVVRKDLHMRKGKIVAQCAHASMKIFFDRIEYCDHGEMKMNKITAEMEEWIDGAFAKICVYVESEEALLEIVEQSKEAGLPIALITDNGLTEFNGVLTNTCCAIGPANAEAIDKITGDLKLL